MNTMTKPKLTPSGCKDPGVLFVDMVDASEADEPPRDFWRVVDGRWKLISLVRPDGTVVPWQDSMTVATPEDNQ